MSQSEDIRNGLVTNLQPLIGGSPVGQISPYELANATPPCVYVTGGEIVYDEAMHRGLDRMTFTVIALVSQTVDIESQQLLDELREPTGTVSVKTLIESDPFLGGVVADLHVTNVSPPRMYEPAAAPARLGCEWTVEVLAPSS